MYGGCLLCPLYPLLAFTELTFGRINVHATLSSPNMVQVVVVVGWVRGLMEPLSEVFAGAHNPQRATAMLFFSMWRNCPGFVLKVYYWWRTCLWLAFRKQFAGKAYLKINLLVKTPLHGRSMEVRRSGLWAPGFWHVAVFPKDFTFSGKLLIFSTRSLRHILENP